MPELKERLDFAVRAAIQAGRLTTRYFRSSDLTIETKPDDTPVTRADKESEETLRNHLAKEFPNDSIVGEEFGTQPGSTGYTWYLDPIDGTKSFIRGIPLYGTMMGLEYESEAVAGVIVFPALDELVYAAKGLGSWWSDQLDPVTPKRACVSNISRLSEAYFTTTSPPHLLGHRQSRGISKTRQNRYRQPRTPRLLRTLPSRHRTRRNHDRPHHECLRQRAPTINNPRSRRDFHRSARKRHHPRRQCCLHQPPSPQRSPRNPQHINETSSRRKRDLCKSPVIPTKVGTH